MKKRVALILQPSLAASGGGAILSLIGDQLKKNNEVDLIYLVPLISDGVTKKSKIFILKCFIKAHLSRWKNRKFKIRIIYSLKKISNCYDKIIAGWVGDVSLLVSSGIPSNKIIHICQSIESWGGNSHDCYTAYTTRIDRLFVSEWMASRLACTTDYNALISVALRDHFLLHALPSSIEHRKYISYLSHPGWWKNSTEASILARILSEKLNLKIQTFGENKNGDFDLYIKSPDSMMVMNCLDKTRIFIALSFYEGMPIMVLEAIARGCIVILSNIPGHQEIYKKFNSKYIYIIDTAPLDYGSLDDLVNNIKIILNKPVNRSNKIEFYSHKNFMNRLGLALDALL